MTEFHFVWYFLFSSRTERLGCKKEKQKTKLNLKEWLSSIYTQNLINTPDSRSIAFFIDNWVIYPSVRLRIINSCCLILWSITGNCSNTDLEPAQCLVQYTLLPIVNLWCLIVRKQQYYKEQQANFIVFIKTKGATCLVSDIPRSYYIV